GVVGVELAGDDLALERLAVGAAHVAQAARARAAQRGELARRRNHARAAARLDVGQLQLLAQDLGHLLQRELHLQEVLAGLAAGRAARRALALLALVAGAVALALALAAAVAPEAQARQLDARHGDGHEVPALAPDHLAARHVAAQVVL